MKHRFTTCLWFNGQAEEAAQFYTGIFKKSKITRTLRYSSAGAETHRHEPGSVLTVEFELDGQPMMTLNGGPEFKFNEAVSLIINCSNQDEVDYYWTKLSAGGDPNAQQCGWLKDRYGVSWQVVPENITELYEEEESPGAKAAMEAMMKMKKLDIEVLQRAHDEAETAVHT